MKQIYNVHVTCPLHGTLKEHMGKSFVKCSSCQVYSVNRGNHNHDSVWICGLHVKTCKSIDFHNSRM